ncbi:intradiol ring-cleavage dioxygenase [Nonomuraea sp. NPDC050663]|uniref:intradiol ring-cleavage dioxygenase n=1 Tax=Nonomuraea sp. NPDC050663 TaxID=3364370 RepID=UPI00379465A4
MTADHHEGQRVSRRRIIAGIGSIGLGAILTACSTSRAGAPAAVATTEGTASITPRTAPATGLDAMFARAGTCTLTEATTQGPYYFDADKVRSDIREDRQGVRLALAIKVQDSEKCTPIPDAVVEIWHCDAAGLYSGAEAMSRGEGGGGMGGGDLEPQDGKRYLRGAQVTDQDGIVRFTTIWPGWYRGRTVHIHAMVHVGDQRTLTTQVIFPEDLNTEVLQQQPYTGQGERDTFNDDDGIAGESTMLVVAEEGDGYQAVAIFGVNP